MPTVNNIEHLRRWFRQCPLISRDNRFRVDYMAEDPTEYSIYATPSNLRYHENVLGESVLNDVQTLNFIFASREHFGADELQNIANYGFYQDVTEWISAQNNAHNFPEINEGRVTSIIPTLSAYVAAVGADSARYQIQLALTYRRY